MSEISQSSEVAREALLRLAVRRLPPTPDNYRALYHEIAGTSGRGALPRADPEGPRRPPAAYNARCRYGYVRQIEDAVAGHDLSAIGAALAAVLAAKEPPAWTALIRELAGPARSPPRGPDHGAQA
ncbi:MAG: hypothetical protein MZW92_52680 [Comamonadaceae bacterium]|nr:hypothetical protein [Comamonadaceae bacterium]